MAKIKAGQLPGPEMSIAKLSLTNNLRRISNLVSTVLGPDVGVDPTRRPLVARLHPATFRTAFRVVDLLMALALLVATALAPPKS